MIVYDLICENHHRFEGWFTSSGEFERQQRGHSLNCPVCGSESVAKLLTAGHIHSGAAEPAPIAKPQAQSHDEYSRLIELVLQRTENVGEAFPEEARKIYYGESPERGIRGSATPAEALELLEEGIKVMLLPVKLPTSMH